MVVIVPRHQVTTNHQHQRRKDDPKNERTPHKSNQLTVERVAFTVSLDVTSSMTQFRRFWPSVFPKSRAYNV